jgi:hypothetical protein
MARHLAKLICLAAAGVAGWQVWLNLDEIVEGGHLPIAIGAGAGIVVWFLLYFLLARPIADVIADRMSALHSRVRSTRAGTGLDEVPDLPRSPAARQPDTCRICGGPGGPVCSHCQAEISGG